MSVYRAKIIKLLCDKIDSGEEKHITKHEVESIELVYDDCYDEVGQGEIDEDFRARLSEKTIREIARL